MLGSLGPSSGPLVLNRAHPLNFVSGAFAPSIISNAQNFGTGLLADWTVLPDGNGSVLVDNCGYSNAALYGGAKLTPSTRPGGYGQLTLNGTSQYAQASSNPMFGTTATGNYSLPALTISGWA